MASTNKTTYYELSQYVGSDKPTYLTDYNTDMANIDAGIHAAQAKADGADTKADTADGKADGAVLTANTALTNAGTANTNIGTMANLSTTEKTSLVGAINEVDTGMKKNAGDIANFNLTTTTSYTNSDFTFTNCTGIANACDITIAKNSDGSLAKIYGRVFVNVSSGAGASAKISTTLAPTSEFTINPIGVMQNQSTKAMWYITATVKTNGDVVFNFPNIGQGDYYSFVMPCLYYIKDFGDIPVS
ncbi:MAG: hypothetical protein J6T10_28130 [Methanobrevibacter sp.]|nr:hypothetical protein [Methanobrevibacter sp.]